MRRAAFAVPWLAFLSIYAPDVGHGFLRDDYAWITAARAAQGASGLLRSHTGFYRPLVTLSFAADDALFGLAPLAYGLTNLALAAACAALLAATARALGLPGPLAVLAAALWAFNPHGTLMALMWISGRTALLLLLFALLAALATARGAWALAGGACALALLAKEEAVALPAVLAAWAALLAPPDGRRRAAALSLLGTAPALAGYLALRLATEAYLPWNAPAFYRPTLSLLAVARNLAEYADRAGTLAAVTAVAALALGARRTGLTGQEKRWLALGFVWTAGLFALTAFLPVRSSLYACAPAAGTALMAAAVVHAAVRATDDRGRRRLLGAGLLAPLLLVPLYHDRNRRWLWPAELAASALAELRGAGADLAAGQVVVLHDDPADRYNLASAFGTLAPEAVRLATGVAAARVWVEPPPAGWESAGLAPPRPGEPVRRYALKEGTLQALADVPTAAPAR